MSAKGRSALQQQKAGNSAFLWCVLMLKGRVGLGGIRGSACQPRAGQRCNNRRQETVIFRGVA